MGYICPTLWGQYGVYMSYPVGAVWGIYVLWGQYGVYMSCPVRAVWGIYVLSCEGSVGYICLVL